MESGSEFSPTAPFRFGYPARLPDGSYLVLPIRELATSNGRAVASLIANQASFEVVRVLADFMAVRAQQTNCELVVGLPTLGMVFAPLIAQALGHARYVPLGYSRKFWYRDEFSVSVRSLTSPDQIKRLYIDPNQLELVAGHRVLIVDDAVSTGGTLSAAIELLERVGATVEGAVVAMRQGNAWRDRLGAAWAEKVAGVLESPHLRKCEGGWCIEA